MINQSSIEKRVKQLVDNTTRLKASQPMYNGQLYTNIILSSVTSTLTGGFTSGAHIIYGTVRFRNQSGILPFVDIIPIFYDGATQLDSSKINIQFAARQPALYIMGGTVGISFRVRMLAISQNTLTIKYYIKTNDTGGDIDANGTEWNVIQ